jgi:hypothetical protein
VNKNILVAILSIATALLNFATGFTLRQGGRSGTIYLTLGLTFVIIAAIFLKKNRDKRINSREK